MAGKAHFVFFKILDLLGTVFPFLQISGYLFVANQAVVRLKGITCAFSDCLRVGMKSLLFGVLMAILARCLSVD
jgi:hypothetical protein